MIKFYAPLYQYFKQYRIRLYSCILSFCGFCTAAQAPAVIRQEQPGQTDSAYILSLINTGQAREALSLDSATVYYREALRLLQVNPVPSLMAFALAKLGYTERIKGDYKKGLIYLKQAADTAKKYGGHTFLLNMYNNIAACYGESGSYYWSIIYYSKGVSLMQEYPQMKQTVFAAQTYCGLGQNWIDLKEPELGIKYLDSAEQVAIGIKDSSVFSNVALSRGRAYFITNKKLAGRYFEEALHTTYISSSATSIIAYLYLGELESEDGHTQEAFAYLDTAFKLRDRLPVLHQKALLLPDIYLANAYFSNKEYGKAEHLLLSLLYKADDIQDKDILLNAHYVLGSVYTSMGKYQKANQHLKIYIDLLENIKHYDKEKAIGMMLEYQAADKDKEIAQKQLLIAGQQSSLREKNFWISGITLGVLLLTFLLLAFYRNNRHKQKLQASAIANLQQQRQIDQLQALMQGEEQERNRIARELHDGIGSMIAAARMHLDVFDKSTMPPEETSGYQNGLGLLDEAYQELRFTAHNLLTDKLMDEGLTIAVKSYCQKLSYSGLQIYFQAIGSVPELQKDKAISLYRIIQELIHNAAKHSEATEVIVEIAATEEQLSLSVEDNGKGWKVAENIVPDGIGMRNLKQRIEVSGGLLEIDSRQGVGTTIYITFPIEKISKAHDR